MEARDAHFPEPSFSEKAHWARKVWPLEGQWTRASEADPAGSSLWFSGPKREIAASGNPSQRLGCRRLDCCALQRHLILLEDTSVISAQRRDKIHSLNKYFVSTHHSARQPNTHGL